MLLTKKHHVNLWYYLIQMTSNTLQLAPVPYHLFQLVSTLPIYFIHKSQLNWHSASLFSTSSLITATLAICNMAESKVNRELAHLGVSVTNIDMNEDMQLKVN